MGDDQGVQEAAEAMGALGVVGLVPPVLCLLFLVVVFVLAATGGRGRVPRSGFWAGSYDHRRNRVVSFGVLGGARPLRGSARTRPYRKVSHMSYGPPPPPGGYGTGGYPSQRPYFGEPPKNYLVHNILGLFGCLSVLSIIGLVFALQVDSKWRMGDYIGAQEAARTAKTMGIIGLVGFILLIAFLVAYFLFFVFIFGVAVTSPATY